MVKYRETKACDVDLKLTAFVSLWTLNHAHCQIEILIFSARSPLVLPLASFKLRYVINEIFTQL